MITTSLRELCKLTTLIFEKAQKAYWIKGMKNDLALSEIEFKNKKANLNFHRIFDNPLAKYLISIEFLECIDYISSYLQKSEKTQ